MPTYTINMDNGSRNAWADGASALAKALTPDYKGQADMAGAAAQADAAYARSAASLASRDKTLAEKGLIDRKAGLLGEMDAQLRAMVESGEVDWEEAQILKAEFASQIDPVATLPSFGDTNLAMGALRGADDEQLSRLQTGAGLSFGNTIGGTRENMTNENSKWLMEQAGDRGKAELDRAHELTMQDRAPLNVGENSTTLVGPLHPLYNAQNQGRLRGQMSVGDTETVYPGGDADPISGGGVTQPFDPNDPNGFTPLAGSGLDQQAINYITNYNLKKQRGETTSSGEDFQYLQLFNRSYGIQTREVPNADGTKTLIQVQEPVPPGIWNPNTKSITASAADEATAAAATGEGDPSGIVVASTTVGSAREKLTEGQQKLKDLGGGFVGAVSSLNALVGYDPNTGEFPRGTNFPGLNAVMGDAVEEMFGSGSAIGSYAGNLVRTQNSEAFQSVGFNMTEPLLRFRSGAATPEEEIARYKKYGPQAGLTDAENMRRVRNLNLMALAIAEVATSQGLTSEALMALGDDHPSMPALRAAVNAELAALAGAQGTGEPPGPRVPDPASPAPAALQSLVDRWATQ